MTSATLHPLFEQRSAFFGTLLDNTLLACEALPIPEKYSLMLEKADYAQLRANPHQRMSLSRMTQIAETDLLYAQLERWRRDVSGQRAHAGLAERLSGALLHMEARAMGEREYLQWQREVPATYR